MKYNVLFKVYLMTNIKTKKIDDVMGCAFVPMIELTYKNSRQVRKELRPMFSSYVLIDTKLDAITSIMYKLGLIILKDYKVIIEQIYIIV